MNERNYRSIEDSRHVSYDFFHLRKRVTLYFETDEKTVKIQGYVEENNPGIFSKQEETAISIICPDPWFYELTDAETVFSGIEALFEFPFENDSLTEKLLIMGEIKDNIVETFYYRGDVEVGFEAEIYFTGKVGTRLRIMNLDKREVLTVDLTAVATIVGKPRIDYGDMLLISTVPGNKYCILRSEGWDYDCLNAVKKESTWPMIYAGENTFGYDVSEGMENVLFRITYAVAYEGL